MDGFFGIGISELFMIAVVALIVLGPERLPGALREVAKFIRMVRNMTNELTSQFGDEFKVLEDLNPQKILRDLVDEPDEKAKAAAKTATTAAKPAVKPATKPATATTPKPATSTTPKPTTPKPAAPKPTTPKPAVAPKTAGAVATSQSTTESAVATVDEAAVAVEGAPVAVVAATETATAAEVVAAAPVVEKAMEATTVEGATVESTTVEASESQLAPEAPDEEPSILPPARREQLLAEQAADVAPVAESETEPRVMTSSVESDAPAIEQASTLEVVEAVIPASVLPEASPEAVVAPEAMTSEAMTPEEVKPEAIESVEVSPEEPTESVIVALANTALDTVPENHLPEDVATETSASDATDVAGDAHKPVDDAVQSANELSALPTRSHVTSASKNGTHVNGTSSESEP